MSERPATDTAPPSYDVADLRERMAVCFTVGELRALADAAGAEGVRTDRGTADTARLLVRHFERQGALAELVAILRREKPLVEWPDPLAPPDAHLSPFGPAPPRGSVDVVMPEVAADSSDAAPPPHAPFGAPRRLTEKVGGAAFVGATDDFEGPVIQDPHAPPPTQPWISGGDGVVRPGGGSSRPPAPRGMDPRILIAVAGLMLLAAVFAFAAGRATNHASSPDAGGPSGAPMGSGAAASPRGPTALALGAFSRSLGDVARACEMPVPDAPSGDLLRAVFDRCGQRRPRPPVNAPPAAPSAEATADPDTAPDRAHPSSPSGHDALPPGPTDTACFKGCQRDHVACKSKCGPEPTDASLYGDYQGCLAKCLAGASKCRLGCAQ